MVCLQVFTSTRALCKNWSVVESGEISSSQFLFWDPHHISETNGASRLKFGTLVQAYEGTMATCKNLFARGRLWEDQQPPLFILRPPLYLRNKWSQEVGIWFACRLLRVLGFYVKNLSASGRLGSQFLFWDPLHISEANGARMLKFSTLVGI